jgi:hypothetical protein
MTYKQNTDDDRDEVDEALDAANRLTWANKQAAAEIMRQRANRILEERAKKDREERERKQREQKKGK